MIRPPDSSAMLRAAVSALYLVLTLLPAGARPQTPARTPEAQDDVVRIETELVQTDVMVFDKQGRFVEGLRSDQFELKVDGKPVPVSFFEFVTAGSAEEEKQLAAARRGEAARSRSETTPPTADASRGRSVFFFVDDLHLNPESLVRTQRMLVRAIDGEMGPSDRVLITAASGQLGAQQLTSDREALKATAGRLALRRGSFLSTEKPPMSEYQAISINRGDRGLLDFYVEQILKFEPMTSREMAEEKVRSRAEAIIDQSAPVATATLSSLETFIKDVARIPGRKLVIFVSDGFIMENERSLTYPRLRSVTETAARAGVVIYALNAQGLVTGMSDASTNVPADGRLSRTAYGAETVSHDVLHSLAVDTGGRALVNTNDMDAGVRRALEETSKYYLIAWRPPKESAGGEGFKKVEVSIAGRRDLSVRVRRNPGTSVSSALAADASAPPAISPAEELKSALESPSLPKALPASLVIVFRGPKVPTTASMQIPSTALTFVEEGGRQVATVDVGGIVLDERGGEVTSFNRRIGVNADSNAIDPDRKLLFYNHDLSLPPGRYEIRMGARDARTGKMGGASQSFEVLDVLTGQIALSSLMLLERTNAEDEEETSHKPAPGRGVTLRFARTSRLRFLTYVYNAASSTVDDASGLEVKARILQGERPVSIPELREILIEDGEEAEGHPFAAEISLDGLQPGEYVLQVTVTDKVRKTSAVRTASFVVE